MGRERGGGGGGGGSRAPRMPAPRMGREEGGGGGGGLTGYVVGSRHHQATASFFESLAWAANPIGHH